MAFSLYFYLLLGFLDGSQFLLWILVNLVFLNSYLTKFPYGVLLYYFNIFLAIDFPHILRKFNVYLGEIFNKVICNKYTIILYNSFYYNKSFLVFLWNIYNIFVVITGLYSFMNFLLYYLEPELFCFVLLSHYIVSKQYNIDLLLGLKKVKNNISLLIQAILILSIVFNSGLIYLPIIIICICIFIYINFINSSFKQKYPNIYYLVNAILFVISGFCLYKVFMNSSGPSSGGLGGPGGQGSSGGPSGIPPQGPNSGSSVPSHRPDEQRRYGEYLEDWRVGPSAEGTINRPPNSYPGSVLHNNSGLILDKVLCKQNDIIENQLRQRGLSWEFSKEDVFSRHNAEAHRLANLPWCQDDMRPYFLKYNNCKYNVAMAEQELFLVRRNEALHTITRHMTGGHVDFYGNEKNLLINKRIFWEKEIEKLRGF